MPGEHQGGVGREGGAVGVGGHHGDVVEGEGAEARQEERGGGGGELEEINIRMIKSDSLV